VDPTRGKTSSFKNDMSRDDDVISEEIKTVIPLVARGVTKEKTMRRARRELVRSSVPYRAKWGVGWFSAFKGRLLRRCVEVFMASAQ
jgi:hypothetical protein